MRVYVYVFNLYNFVVSETFHKYDGFIYPEPHTLSWERFISSENVFEKRRAFVREFFPKWGGFYADSLDSEIQFVEALRELDNLVKDISDVWTKGTNENQPRRRHVDSSRLKLGDVSAKKVLALK